MSVVRLAQTERAREWVAKLDTTECASQRQFPLLMRST